MSVAQRLVHRRVFFGTLAAGAAALAVRVALLPRPLSEAEIARLGEVSGAGSTPAPPGDASPTLMADTRPPDAEVNLAGSMGRLNPLAQNLELVPQATRFRQSFKINTVEREPQKGLVDRQAWSVAVDGLADNPFELTPALLADLPRAVRVADFHCVEGWGVRDVRWEGVQLATLLAHAGVRPDAGFATFLTLGGVYADSLTLEQARHPDVLLATHVNGQPLSDRQGYPIRLVVPFMYGYKSVKWVARVTLEPKRLVGFWERRGWQLDPYV